MARKSCLRKIFLPRLGHCATTAPHPKEHGRNPQIEWTDYAHRAERRSGGAAERSASRQFPKVELSVEVAGVGARSVAGPSRRGRKDGGLRAERRSHSGTFRVLPCLPWTVLKDAARHETGAADSQDCENRDRTSRRAVSPYTPASGDLYRNPQNCSVQSDVALPSVRKRSVQSDVWLPSVQTRSVQSDVWLPSVQTRSVQSDVGLPSIQKRSVQSDGGLPSLQSRPARSGVPFQ